MTPTSAQSDVGPVEVRVLGPLLIRLGDLELEIGPRREQALLELLILGAGQVQPAERLIERLWDGTPPEGASTTLRSYISHLRSNLGGHDGLGGRLITRAAGYAFDVSPADIDFNRFRELVASGRAQLDQGDHESARRTLEEALALWRGEPFAEIAHLESVVPVLGELRELRISAVEGRLWALLHAGRHVDALPSLEALVREEPLRETPREMQMIALYRDGRAPEALAVHREYGRLLADELGIDPSARLDALFQRILNRDPSLERERTVVSVAPHMPFVTHDAGTDNVQLATQLIESLREVSQAAILAACELMKVLQAADRNDVRREPARVPLSA